MTSPLPGDIFGVGQVLNNTYEIDKILGRGGTGEVYRARNKITGRLVAVKALNRQFSGNADYIELMKREDEMRSIQHPAVVRYIECSMSDADHVFLVMDYVEGPPLSDVMAERRMDPRELLIIGHGVAEGLVATHAQGIIHRDLSPDNIILRHGEPANATIIDFGIAKDTAVGARTVVGSDFAGKYEYSAPEQLEGHVDQQSDLYALGATLLAAWRGDIPFLGATPGEIIRRKQSPLDTEGVPEPLRGIIDTLTSPDPASRPASAAALVKQISAVLRPEENQQTIAEKPKRAPRRLAAIVAVALLSTFTVGWFSGGFDRFMTPPLPHADPYLLTLAFDKGADAILTGNAPDQEAETRLRETIAQALGMASSGDIALATGLPDSNWEADARGLIEQVAILENGQLTISNQTASIRGFATDIPTKAALSDALDSFAADRGWRISKALTAGPLEVSGETIQGALRDVADCGPLQIEGGNGGIFELTDKITVTGNMANSDQVGAASRILQPLIGERNLTVATQILNPELCMIRQALVSAPTNIVTLALSNGETGERNLSGVFTTGQNPVVDVLIPEQFSTSALWVMAVNPDGSVFHVVPNIYNEDNRVDQLATLDDGLHRIRALFSFSEFINDNSKLAIKVTDQDYGKSEVIAILSREPLFAGRRPTSESVASTVQALNTIIAEKPNNILGVASAIIDARR